MNRGSRERLRPPLALTAGLAALSGLPCLLAPALVARALGAGVYPELALLLRLFGAAVLALAALAWFAGRPAHPFQREAAAICCGFHAMAAMALWGAVVSGGLSPWLPGAAAVTHLFLAGWIAAALMAR